MPNNEAGFEILADNTTEAVRMATDCVEGTSATGAHGMGNFVFRDSSGNLTRPQLTSVGGIPISFVSFPTFTFFASSITLGNNKAMFAIMNAVGSGKILRLTKIKIVNSQNTAVTGIIADFRLRRITSLTGGTAVVGRSFDTADSLSGSISASTNGTATDAAGPIDLDRWTWSSDDWTTGAPDTESADHALQTLISHLQISPFERPITVRPGEGLVLRQVVNSTAGSFDIQFTVTQE